MTQLPSTPVLSKSLTIFQLLACKRSGIAGWEESCGDMSDKLDMVEGSLPFLFLDFCSGIVS